MPFTSHQLAKIMLALPDFSVVVEQKLAGGDTELRLIVDAKVRFEKRKGKILNKNIVLVKEGDRAS